MMMEPPVSRKRRRQKTAAALRDDPLVGHVARDEEDGEDQVLPHLEAAQDGPRTDEEAGGGKLGAEEAIGDRPRRLAEEANGIEEEVQRQAGGRQEVGGRQGRAAVTFYEDHQEPEAHQEHRHDVDGPLVALDLFQGGGRGSSGVLCGGRSRGRQEDQ